MFCLDTSSRLAGDLEKGRLATLRPRPQQFDLFQDRGRNKLIIHTGKIEALPSYYMRLVGDVAVKVLIVLDTYLVRWVVYVCIYK